MEATKVEFSDFFRGGKTYVEFNDRDGRNYALIDFQAPQSLKVWNQPRRDSSGVTSSIGFLNVIQIHSETLKELDIWKQLDDKSQLKVLDVDTKRAAVINEEKKFVHKRMEKARKGRKRSPLFRKMPDKLECSKCGKQTGYSKGAYCKKADEQDKDVMDLIKEYECLKCGGKRGKKSNPEWSNIPDKMVCSCGKEQPVPKRKFVEKAAEEGIDVLELVKSYQCRDCKKKA